MLERHNVPEFVILAVEEEITDAVIRCSKKAEMHAIFEQPCPTCGANRGDPCWRLRYDVAEGERFERRAIPGHHKARRDAAKRAAFR
jgi:hypothetical protein